LAPTEVKLSVNFYHISLFVEKCKKSFMRAARFNFHTNDLQPLRPLLRQSGLTRDLRSDSYPMGMVDVDTTGHS